MNNATMDELENESWFDVLIGSPARIRSYLRSHDESKKKTKPTTKRINNGRLNKSLGLIRFRSLSQDSPSPSFSHPLTSTPVKFLTIEEQESFEELVKEHKKKSPTKEKSINQEYKTPKLKSTQENRKNTGKSISKLVTTDDTEESPALAKTTPESPKYRFLKANISQPRKSSSLPPPTPPQIKVRKRYAITPSTSRARSLLARRSLPLPDKTVNRRSKRLNSFNIPESPINKRLTSMQNKHQDSLVEYKDDEGCIITIKEESPLICSPYASPPREDQDCEAGEDQEEFHSFPSPAKIILISEDEEENCPIALESREIDQEDLVLLNQLDRECNLNREKSTSDGNLNSLKNYTPRRIASEIICHQIVDDIRAILKETKSKDDILESSNVIEKVSFGKTKKRKKDKIEVEINEYIKTVNKVVSNAKKNNKMKRKQRKLYTKVLDEPSLTDSNESNTNVSSRKSILISPRSNKSERKTVQFSHDITYHIIPRRPISPKLLVKVLKLSKGQVQSMISKVPDNSAEPQEEEINENLETCMTSPVFDKQSESQAQHIDDIPNSPKCKKQLNYIPSSPVFEINPEILDEDINNISNINVQQTKIPSPKKVSERNSKNVDSSAKLSQKSQSTNIKMLTSTPKRPVQSKTTPPESPSNNLTRSPVFDNVGTYNNNEVATSPVKVNSVIPNKRQKVDSPVFESPGETSFSKQTASKKLNSPVFESPQKSQNIQTSPVFGSLQETPRSKGTSKRLNKGKKPKKAKPKTEKQAKNEYQIRTRRQINVEKKEMEKEGSPVFELPLSFTEPVVTENSQEAQKLVPSSTKSRISFYNNNDDNMRLDIVEKEGVKHITDGTTTFKLQFNEQPFSITFFLPDDAVSSDKDDSDMNMSLEQITDLYYLMGNIASVFCNSTGKNDIFPNKDKYIIPDACVNYGEDVRMPIPSKNKNILKNLYDLSYETVNGMYECLVFIKPPRDKLGYIKIYPDGFKKKCRAKFLLVFYVISGEVSFVKNKTVILLSKGDNITINANDKYSIHNRSSSNVILKIMKFH